jgi:hypothetical protein
MTAKKTAILASALLALIVVLHPIASKAQSFLSLTAIPPRLEVNIKPGEVITKTIRVRNDSTVERAVTVDVRDYIVSDDTGTPIQLDPIQAEASSNRWAAASWVQVSPSHLLIKPGETKAVAVTIIAPEDALPGGHYAMVLNSPDAAGSLSESGASIITNVGTLLYIKVPGAIHQEAKIKEFFAPFFQEFGPINFRTIINNLSDIHISPVGTIKITNWLGQPTSELALQAANIFPYANREFSNVLERKWLFGRYKATLVASYGTTGDFVTSTLFFWVLPWRLITLIAVTILILILLISILSSNRKPDSPTTKRIEEVEEELKALKNKYKDR